MSDQERQSLSEHPKPLGHRIREHLNVQFPSTVGHIPLTIMLTQVDYLERERDIALSDFRQADTDSIRALHERNEARKQRDALAEALREMRYGHTDKAEKMAIEALNYLTK